MSKQHFFTFPICKEKKMLEFDIFLESIAILESLTWEQ